MKEVHAMAERPGNTVPKPTIWRLALIYVLLYRTQFFGQVAALNQAALRANSQRTSAGVL
jgi:hypothetical protein